MKIVLIAGLSASGKSTVLDQLCEKHNYTKVVTSTTRDPRPGEVNGIDYNFLSKAEFEKKIEEGYFLEHVNIKGNYYGSGFDASEPKYQTKQPAMILDPVGVKNLSDILQDRGHTPINVFVNESPETCIQRVMSRDASNGEKVKRVNDIRNVEAGWADYMNYDLKTTPLVTVDQNCLDIKTFASDFQEYKFEKKDHKSNNKLKP